VESEKVKYYLPVDTLCCVLLPLPFLLVFLDGYVLNIYTICAGISSLLMFLCAFFLNRNVIIAKYFGISSICFFLLSAFPLIISPFLVLLSLVLFITAFFPLLYLDSISQHAYKNKQNKYRTAQLRFAFAALLLIIVCNLIFYKAPVAYIITFIASCAASSIHLGWAIKNKYIFHGISALCALIFYGLLFLSNLLIFLSFFSLGYCFYIFLFSGHNNSFFKNRDNSLQFLFEKPEYGLVIFFVSLCTVGSLILLLPFSTIGSMAIIDIIFTVVSAASVTGLTVVDVSTAFTAFGKVIIILLIQLGGLGIMSITVFIAYLFRKKLSLAQEKVLTEITMTDNKTLISSLLIVLKVTFIVESIGAIILTACYFNYGDSFYSALGKGIFTSISAFCNAGFTLHSDNLAMYQSSPILLLTVSLLIILGGIAPAACLLIPSWISGKPIAMGVRMPFVMTAYLLVIGTLFILIFEYNGILRHLDFFDKVTNAWFQNVTLRTAGFNTVDISSISGATFIIMLIFMFIGGSPGSTAGGIKTTTLFILIITFWAVISNKNTLTLYKREICKEMSLRAIAIFFSGVLIWIAGVMILEVTQDISIKKIMFEVTSAMGTVGISMGITAMLDEIGKITIIFLMLLGRVGFITIFVLLSRDHNKIHRNYPEVKFTLT